MAAQEHLRHIACAGFILDPGVCGPRVRNLGCRQACAAATLTNVDAPTPPHLSDVHCDIGALPPVSRASRPTCSDTTDRVPASGLKLRVERRTQGSGFSAHMPRDDVSPSRERGMPPDRIFFPALRAGSISGARASRPTRSETTYRRPASGSPPAGVSISSRVPNSFFPAPSGFSAIHLETMYRRPASTSRASRLDSFFSSGRFAPCCPDSSETTYRRPASGGLSTLFVLLYALSDVLTSSSLIFFSF
ncbi:hypothetical protein B0H15DRAFT_1023594 [Mycena belliarum]|uniref:Uncharacterized protein n=1 Tax=Mycena belliarum TaxID=1033014 RepID=A0AAD6TZS2_9AGAR|nr:hypothetical protein B0H15DRAFT_1023594 [Mycena belliae]